MHSAQFLQVYVLGNNGYANPRQMTGFKIKLKIYIILKT